MALKVGPPPSEVAPDRLKRRAVHEPLVDGVLRRGPCLSRRAYINKALRTTAIH